jgi:nicotinamide-nucleotide adenylyltransferase
VDLETIFILDSSYNPPSLAHTAIILEALKQKSVQSFSLLLLFSTTNADKADVPASNAHRLTMMSLFAKDLYPKLEQINAMPNALDIGLTKEAYYTDKSHAIEESAVYPRPAKHVHIMGYDTLIRFLNPKYYSSFVPPLTALEPYFDAGHRLSVLLRPEEDGDDVSSQKSYIQSLHDGSLTEKGFSPNWLDQIEIIENQQAIGISSTRAREAVRTQDLKSLPIFISPSILKHVQEYQLYRS